MHALHRVLGDRPSGHVDGIGEAGATEAAVRHHADPAQAEQVRAPRALGIDLVAQLDQGGPHQRAADVVVTDGFTGNVALKLIEGVSQTLFKTIRDVAEASARAKAGGLLMRGSLRELRADLDPEAAGGAYVLGLRKIGIVHHGRFTRYGISQAIAVAERAARERVVERTQEALEAAGALRTTPSETPANVGSSS